jgi:hypothetical protein
MKTIFSRVFKKKFGDQGELEIDEQVITQSKRPKKREISDYKNYREKDIAWLSKHLAKIDDVFNKQSLGSKNKSSFVIDGHKYYKDDATRDLFNKMFDNYTAYFYALKRYIIVRKELLKFLDLEKDDALLAAGQVKVLEDEASDIEKNLNLYLDNIKRIKNLIREAVGM